MFYSNNMLSRKGPLRNIWEAAYCFNKLKKEEITCTNISSSIDKILPADVQIPYRVLSQLLLGIVKIFSKKVDILYHDCNDALMRVSMSIIPKEATGTRQRKGAIDDATVTIPERLELDSFDLGIQEEVDTTELNQENIMEDALSADRSPRSSLYESYHRDTAELAELTSACLSPLADVLPSFLMDIDVEISNLCDSSSSEAEGGEFLEDSYDAEEYDNNDECMATRNLLGSTFFDKEGGDREHLASLGEIVSQSIEKNSLVNQLEIHMDPVVNLPETITSDPHEGMAVEEYLESLGEINVSQSIEKNSLVNQLEIYMDPVVNLPETITSDPHEGIAIEGLTEDEPPLRSLDIVVYDPNPGVSACKPKCPTKAYKQRFQLVVKRKPVMDETVLLPNESFIHEMNDTSNLLRKRRKVPSASLDVWKASRRANAQKVFMEPLLTGLSSKLKDLYKDKLPNASSSDLVIEPVDSQNVTEPVDFQNVVELADLQTERPDEPSKTVPGRKNIAGNFMLLDVCRSPVNLLTGRSSKLKDLYKDKLSNASSSDLLVETVDSQNVAEPVDFQNVVEPADLQTERPEEPSKTVPDRENISLDNSIPEILVAPTAAEVYEMEPIALNSSSPNSEMDMMDGDFDYHGDDNSEEDDGIADHGDDSNEEDDGIADHGDDSNKDDGIASDTTREAAKFLYRKFASNKAQQNEHLNLSSVLHGSSRNNSAKLFYETLALKSSGCVDVIQDSPYSDIILSATPKLGRLFEKH